MLGRHMSYTQGRPLCPEEKKLLVSVKHYFDRNKAGFRSNESSAQMTADALGVGLATVNRVMANYRKDPDSLNAPPQLRGRPTYSVDVSHGQNALRADLGSVSRSSRTSSLRSGGVGAASDHLALVIDHPIGRMPDTPDLHLFPTVRTPERIAPCTTGLNLSHKLSFALSWEPLHRGGPPWHISTREPVPMPSFGTARRSRCQRWKRWNND